MLCTNKFKIYLNKDILGKIIKYSENTFSSGETLCVNFFYWWYKEIYEFKSMGVCVKKKKKNFLFPLSFKLFFIIKNIRVNQIYFNISPFIIFMKKRNKKKKKIIKLLYII